MKYFINEDWEFTREFDREFLRWEKSGEKVRIPHTCAETPYNHFDAEEYQMDCGYRRKLFFSAKDKEKRAFIKFMGAAHEATVYFNREKVKTHSCGYTAFTIEVTDQVKWGQDNEIAVKLDTRENLNIPPFGFAIDYMTYGGIYRDVIMETREKTFVEDVFFRGDRDGNLECDVTISGEYKDLLLLTEIISDDGEKVYTYRKYLNQPQFTISGQARNVKKWSPDTPVLYTIKNSLFNNDKLVDEYSIRGGFRTAEFREDGFYLNGIRVKLLGLNRHQSYPYVGYAMPESMQKLDADILKNELGVNCVRTSHYPQSQYFVDRCDELGIFVFTEIPGWQHIGNEQWKNQAVLNTREMVSQYRNHPSVILWGVRINESQDDDELYKRTNEAAKEIDPSRATTGVRYLEKSSLLEDVYAFNDFSHTGNNAGLKPKSKVTKDKKKGYIVSECNGHMYPTKSFDCEEHRLSHALRHANVIEAMMASPDIAGVHGWCMFDYNTHKDFGSGDGICYHGVMDMFRNPKLAAAVYGSQGNKMNICEISSSMNIGEHPGGNLGKVYVFTNADFVNLYKNDKLVGCFRPDRTKYAHLLHPPIIIDDFIGELIKDNESYDEKTADQIKSILNAISQYGQGNLPLKYKLMALKLMITKHFTFAKGTELYGKYVANWGGLAPKYKFEAVLNNKIVSVITKQSGSKVKIEAKADHTKLVEKGSYDVALVRIKAVDEFGNVQPYFVEPLVFKTEGDIELIGPEMISLKGGMAGTYVKSVRGGKGGTLTISRNEKDKVVIKFTV